ncbi:MAG: ATP-binding protein [Longimicrobiales bacterium]|nr:ATP-binding protein [Longimicrobiales bacterium]
MKLSTRLLLPLVGAVMAVMTVFAVWAQRQREATMVAEARRETEAYATALGLALEGAFRDPQLAQVQELIDRLSRERTIYAILVYDLDGTARFTSESLQRNDAAAAPIVADVLETGVATSFERVIDDQDVFSVLKAFRGVGGKVAGALEVTQPLSYVQAEMARTRQRFLLNTLVLLAAVAGLTWWLVGRLVSRPLARFSRAAQVLGGGDLSYRVDEAVSSGELAEVARRLNQMADHLETARGDLLAESEERLTLERRLQTSERMAAVGNLAARVGHEIAAPLQVIRGRADLLLRSDKGQEDRVRQLKIIVDQIDRITLIVRNLLSFARRPLPKVRPLELNALLESVSEFLDPEANRAGIKLRRDGRTPQWALGDPDLLYQVFINLILNAIQAMETHGGRHELSITVEPAAGTPADPLAVLVVTLDDTGPGIGEDDLPHIFEPFFTTKSGAAGTGLGLAVARSAMEEMGGTIRAENRWTGPDGETGGESRILGARFIVNLPALAQGEGHLG